MTTRPSRHPNPARPAWVHQGTDALKNAALTCCQKSYALSLRRQLASRLMREASDVSIHFTRSPLGVEFAGIFDACRREVARIERADRRLAHQVHA